MTDQNAEVFQVLATGPKVSMDYNTDSRHAAERTYENLLADPRFTLVQLVSRGTGVLREHNAARAALASAQPAKGGRGD